MTIIKWMFACLAILPLFSHAQLTDASQELKILPAPKEVHLGEGRLTIKPTTIILISNNEDRLAAEMLQKEIRERTGFKLSIESATNAPKMPGHISLGRLTDRGLRSYLESQGVKIDGLGSREVADQAYVIRTSDSGVLVAGNTAQGLFYGVQTLRQLLRQQTPGSKMLAIPALVIRDWPSMGWRGVSDDISRGPIPTLDYLKTQIRTLAEYKINFVGFNMENVFDFQAQSLAAPKGAALTREEIKELVDYAARYFVTILPEQQAFGHLHQFLKYEIYSDLAETPHGHVLTPTNPKTYDFIREVYGEVVPLFPGPFFHIGADETFELGLGRTKDLAAQQGLGRVYLEHLQKVFEIMQPFHKELMFWGDIAVRYPELLTILPKDMIAVPWDYDPKPSYENIITPYTNAGLRVIVSPGAGNWGVVWPDLDSAFTNIRNFVRDGQKHQAMGVLNTTWNDDGESLIDMAWPALIFGATAAWQPGESSIDDFKNSYDWAFYRNNDGDGRTFVGAIENLDRSHTLLAATKLHGASNELFWSDPFSESGANMSAQALPATHDLRLGAERTAESLQHNRTQAQLHAGTLDGMLLAAWHLDTLGMKIQFTSEISHYYWDAYQNQSDPKRVQNDLDEIVDINGRLESLRDAITEMRKTYKEGWARENNSYWLDNVLVRYDNLASEIQAKIVAVQAAERQFESTKTLPAPEQLGFFLK
ncbi:MAG TPA: beta-N-acetylhexosaminidase [Terriglobales bacterium]|jgi:hexosaminidase|nr:beta-N-acetylhexosaminidase [Terriglobales bacterium]